MTPFVGDNFNVTRAGIHADGIVKDTEIYNIFDTKKLLNRPASVMIGKTSGLAGIAYWINENYDLTGDKALNKNDPLVIALKNWVETQFQKWLFSSSLWHTWKKKQAKNMTILSTLISQAHCVRFTMYFALIN